MKKILVGVDGSKHSERALEYALERAKKLGQKVTALRVVPGLGYAGDEVVGALKGEVKDAEEYLKNLEKKVADDGEVDLETDVITGDNIHTEIVKYADENDFDMIVVAGKGKSDLGTVHLGSVSEGIVKRAHCPVLIVR